jgi:AcrR family transcriptional regulator
MNVAEPDTLPTSMSSHATNPTLRVDAKRNRDRILDAARAGFAESSTPLSMAEVARRAGVGSATLYRNFANRRELLEALYVEEIDEICRAATLETGSGPGPRLEAWLRRFYAYFIAKQAIATELLQHSGPDDPVFSSGYNRVLGAGGPLLEAARESGEVDPDLTLEHILDLTIAIAKIPGTESYRAPILNKALAAIRAG